MDTHHRSGRVGLAALVVLVASIAGPATRTSAAGEPRAIRKVDFRNFTYTDLDPDEQPTRVVNGTYERDDQDDQLYVEVLDVDHGDLDGDGIEEAVVTLLSNTGGTGQFTDGRVFRMVGAKPVEVTSLGVGDRADDGIDDVVIVGGVLRVERYVNHGGGACCPVLLERSTFRLKASKLIATARPTLRRLVTFGADEPGDGGRTAVTFVKGTSEAVIDAEAGTAGYFDAAKGQTTTLTMRAPVDGRVTVGITGPGGTRTTLSPPATWSTKLPASGRYVIDLPKASGTIAPQVRMTLSIR